MDEEKASNIFPMIVHLWICLNLTPEEQKSCVFFYGSKEFDLIAAKKVSSNIWQGYGHYRKITENPRAYSDLRNEIFSSNCWVSLLLKQ